MACSIGVALALSPADASNDMRTRVDSVTFEGAEHTVTLAVDEDIDLSNIRVGDRVDALYQESLAISVEPTSSTARD